MNVEKQTLYNTEQLQSLYRNPERVCTSFASDKARGGLYFSLKKRASITLRFRAEGSVAAGTLVLDNLTVGILAKKESEITLRLDAGDHLFEFVADSGTTHDGFMLTAEGVGVQAGRRYLDAVGGYSDDTQTVVYLREGEERVSKYVYQDSALTVTPMTRYRYDEAYLYSRANGAYTTTRRYVYSETKDRFYIYIGRSLYINQTAFRSVAICDARTLEEGADYLVGYVAASRKMCFLRTLDNTRYNSTCYSNIFTGVNRLISAQRGSIFLLENTEHYWSGLYFHADGEKALTFTEHTLHYDEIPLCRNRLIAPTATIDETDGSPIFYFKKEDGALMRMAYGEEATPISYGDALYPGAAGNLAQYDGAVWAEAQ